MPEGASELNPLNGGDAVIFVVRDIQGVYSAGNLESSVVDFVGELC
jgi:hypothetical protein